jgi:ESF2/ABP1 family protein
MATRKRNEYIAADESEDEDQGYNSELAEESKGKAFAGRGAKRRKVEDSGSDSEDEDEEQDISFVTAQDSEPVEAEEEAEENATTKESHAVKSLLPTSVHDELVAPRKKSKLSRKLAKSMERASKTGVIYVSRVPPFMKPHTLKNLLTPFAPSGLGRIFLTPEDPSSHKSRVKSGGNKKRSFLDGWVEFADKEEAEIAADTLNTRPIGGKKGGYYHDDVWCLKFLGDFKWRQLTEEIANQNAERAAKLRAQATVDRKETREFLANVEQAKMLDGMEKKRKGRDKPDEEVSGDVDVDIAAIEGKSVKTKHRKGQSSFRQTEVMHKSKGKSGDIEQPEEVKRVLSKIF